MAACLHVVLAVALLVPYGCSRAAVGTAASVVRVSELRIPFPDPPTAAPEPRVDRPYFEDDGRLRWDGGRVDEPPLRACAEAEPGRLAPPRRAVLARPRVDERRCPEPGGGRRLRKTLVGFDAQGRVSWERPLVFRSGDVEIEQWLIGATPEALVLSDLEVWSPATGETLVPAPTHLAGARPVPDHHFSTSALYLPASGALLAFQADVTLVRREGGVYRIALDTGRKELWLPVSATLTGTYDRVETMAQSRDGRFVLLGLRQEVRGPSSVAVALHDLKTAALAFEERFGDGHSCSDPQVLAGADGHFAFAYRDDNARAHVLVLYRVAP